MRIAFSSTFRTAAGLLLAVLLSCVGYQVLRRRNPGAPEALLKRADEMAWLNNWIAAEPLYRQAKLQFNQKGQHSKALYARVSEIPALANRRQLSHRRLPRLDATWNCQRRRTPRPAFAF